MLCDSTFCCPLGKRGTFLLFCFFLFLLGYSHQKGFATLTPVSRLDLLHSLVTYHTVTIDAYQVNTTDKALFNGHYFSDKAPGTVAIAFLPFWAWSCVLRIFRVRLDSPFGWLSSSWVACALSIGTITSLGATALLFYLCSWTSPRYAFVTVMAIFFGAAPLPYSTMMFSHSIVVGLIAIAMWAIGREVTTARLSPVVLDKGCKRLDTSKSVQTLRVAARKTGGHRTFFRDLHRWASQKRWSLIAGFSCGLALASEYTSGLLVLAVCIWYCSQRKAAVFTFLIAAVLPLVLIPAYSLACIGTPFSLPYSYQASFPEMREGLYGIKLPDPATAVQLLAMPTRGLLFWTPFLLMAGFGCSRLAEVAPRMVLLTYLIPALHLVVISGRTWDWQAGATLGPRYLAPTLPLLAVPCACAMQRFPCLGVGLAVCSIMMTTLATLTDACPGYAINNPLTEIHLPMLLRGEFSPNIGKMVGIGGYGSVGLYYAVLCGGSLFFWKRLPSLFTPLTRLQNTICDAGWFV